MQNVLESKIKLRIAFKSQKKASCMNLYLVEIKQSVLLTVFNTWVQGGVIISQYQESRRRKGEGTERFWGWKEMSLGVITIKWDKAGTE